MLLTGQHRELDVHANLLELALDQLLLGQLIRVGDDHLHVDALGGGFRDELPCLVRVVPGHLLDLGIGEEPGPGARGERGRLPPVKHPAMFSPVQPQRDGPADAHVGGGAAPPLGDQQGVPNGLFVLVDARLGVRGDALARIGGEEDLADVQLLGLERRLLSRDLGQDQPADAVQVDALLVPVVGVLLGNPGGALPATLLIENERAGADEGVLEMSVLLIDFLGSDGHPLGGGVVDERCVGIIEVQDRRVRVRSLD